MSQAADAEPTITYTLRQEDVPEVVRQTALSEGEPLEEFVKEGLLMVAARIASAPPAGEKRTGRAGRTRAA
jgi:hypothetical protein